jgi:HEAT repeat protein
MIHPLSRVVLSLCLLAALPAHAAADGDMAPNDKELAQLYWRGQEALKKSDWNVALERFRRLEADLRSKEPQNADAAIYWQAYTLLQAKRTAEAKTTLERLQRDFPKSRWSRDADALLRQAQPAAVPSKAAVGDDDDLARIAVEGLMNAPPERALPLLRKVLQSNHSPQVKKRALFVLSQIDEPAALDTLGDIARSSNDPGLRDEAIRMLGISGDESAVERLSAMFAASKDSAVKSRIVQAWLIADRQDLILLAARNETDSAVRAEAIRTLGAMSATKELRELFDSEKDPGNRKAIIQSLGIAGDAPTLAAIAVSTQPEELRVQAIQAIGIAGGDAGSEALVKLYSTASSVAIRDAVVHGMLIAGDSKSMLQLYRQAKTKEEKQTLLRTLTLLDSDEALDLIEAELNQGGGKP